MFELAIKLLVIALVVVAAYNVFDGGVNEA